MEVSEIPIVNYAVNIGLAFIMITVLMMPFYSYYITRKRKKK